MVHGRRTSKFFVKTFRNTARSVRLLQPAGEAKARRAASSACEARRPKHGRRAELNAPAFPSAAAPALPLLKGKPAGGSRLRTLAHLQDHAAKHHLGRPFIRTLTRVSRQARLRAITVDDQLQAPRLVFHIPHLRHGEEFCRVRTRPPTDVRRTRFHGHQVELTIYGPVLWKIGDVTILELESYKTKKVPVSAKGRARYRRFRASPEAYA